MARRRLQQVNITVTMRFHFYYGSVSEKIQNYDKMRQGIPERKERGEDFLRYEIFPFSLGHIELTMQYLRPVNGLLV